MTRVHRSILFLALFGLLGLVQSQELPSWGDTPSVRQTLRPGLWPSPDELAPLDISAILIKPSSQAEEEERPGFDINATILIQEPTNTTPPSPIDSKIPWDYMDEYVSRKPIKHLVDPQYLLGEFKSADVRQFLAYHASEADIAIYSYLYEGYQETGASSNLEEQGNKWFPDSQTCMVSYYLGAPERTQLALCGGLKEEVSTNKRAEILADCIQDALVAQDPTDQFERFLTRLSIRLFWLQREINSPQIGIGESGQPYPASEKNQPFWKTPGATTAVVALCSLFLAVIAGVAIGIWMMRQGSEVHAIHIFPEPEFTTRLGAPHSGGNSAVISF